MGQHFALKMIYKKKIKEDEHYSIHFKSERTALGVVRDGTFLSTLFYAFQTETNLYLVMGEHICVVCISRYHSLVTFSSVSESL